MRFILRSAFWLTAAFMVIAPTTGKDMTSVATNAGTQIVADGHRLVAAGLEQMACDSIECTLGRNLIVSTLPAVFQSSIVPMQDAVLVVGSAPVPPPRPDWAY